VECRWCRRASAPAGTQGLASVGVSAATVANATGDLAPGGNFVRSARVDQHVAAQASGEWSSNGMANGTRPVPQYLDLPGYGGSRHRADLVEDERGGDDDEAEGERTDPSQRASNIGGDGPAPGRSGGRRPSAREPGREGKADRLTVPSSSDTRQPRPI
jgi:hypothetical protein